MTVSAVTILVVALVLLVVALFALWLYSIAHRLDRLHVRSDQSWAALDAALSRRAAVARAASTTLTPAQRKVLAGAAERAERAPRATREAAENALSVELSRLDLDSLPAQLVAELADADARVLIARRFNNDAVRDTLALRRRRMVRLFHLGGTAPMPTYFELAEVAALPGPGSEALE